MRSALGALWASVALCVAVPSWAADRQPLEVSAKGAQLSVNARDVPVKQVLASIGNASGIHILVESTVDVELASELTSIEFSDVPVEDGLKRLLRERNVMFVYEPSGLIEVRVYAHGPPGAAPVARDRMERLTSTRQPAPAARALPDATPDEPDDAAVLDKALATLRGGKERAALEEALDTLQGLEKVPFEPLLAFVASNSDAELRARALDMLSEHGGKDARFRTLLRSLASSDPDEDVRNAAQDLLGSHGR